MKRETGKRGTGKQSHRILIVDDHPLVRERLAEIIQEESGLVVCGEAGERSDAIECIARLNPDLAIIDLTLKNSDGLELIKDIRARWPKLLMLVVSMHDEALYAERVVRAGAHGYITKQEATKKIIAAIRDVLDGKIYLSGPLAAKLLGRILPSKPPEAVCTVEALTDRELQVFELTGRGINNHQIARELHISVKTVQTYRARIREKLNLNSASELLQAAIAHCQRP